MSDESVQANLPIPTDPPSGESTSDTSPNTSEKTEASASKKSPKKVKSRAAAASKPKKVEAATSEKSSEMKVEKDNPPSSEQSDKKGEKDEMPAGERKPQQRRNRRGRRKPQKRDERDSGEPAEPKLDKDGNVIDEPQKSRKERYRERKEKERTRQIEALESAPSIESEGLVEISSKGFGFLRDKGRGFQQAPKDDVFITPEIVREHGLRDGLWIKCISKQGLRGPQLIELLTINGKEPAEYHNLPYFEELTAINPNKAFHLETIPTRYTTRVIDMLAPIGRGQRGLIVAPPRTGKTTLLHHIADAIQENYEEEVHLMVLLVDERPEEVTDFQRSFPDAEIFSSSNDSHAKDHTRIALLAIERAKRLVEAGEDVFILMDSITRLARAFNSSMRGGKRGTASGGLVVGALEAPRRIFAAARNTREAGSLTIIATALIQTNSKADEAIFQEFKGTGNMELVLDRLIAQNYVYPAVDIHKSGTRREELLMPPHILEKIHVLRRGLGGYKPVDGMEWMLKCMERYDTNAQMLLEIKLSATS